ncbi:WG repeat-containing protein [Candidimonas nitroreducens]|uniref:WG repeat-containing protein n=1 Tax=Candidimonas nitroreducens TaxID=683354 RepID=A0A225MMR3_9BURK|nr:WG repeat-containing protein [Candidimonas nitroreducens]OWT60059.1 hypothetical protein CEY11_10300 [Candidimonas nitroreducens]
MFRLPLKGRFGPACLLCVLLIAGMAKAAPAPTAPSPPRYILCDDYCALVNQRGGLVTTRLFQKIHPFEGPVAIFEHDGKRGAIDAQGRVVLAPIYSDLEIVGGGKFLVARRAVPTQNQKPTDSIYTYAGKLILRREGSSGVGVWQGRPYYWICPPGSPEPGASDHRCGAVFVGMHGKPAIRFKRFIPGDGRMPGRASTDGSKFGLIDRRLKFMTAQQYTDVWPLAGHLIAVSTGQGIGVVDAQGQTVIPVGRYEEIFFGSDDLFILAYDKGAPDCGRYLYKNGRPVSVPAGVCAGPAMPQTAQAGYALVTNGRGLGAIDARGRIIVPMKYANLGRINRHYLGFGSQRNGVRWGVLDRNGRLIFKADYRNARAGPGDTLALQTDSGWGLLAASGKWLAEPRFEQVEVLGDKLAVLKLAQSGNTPGSYLFFDGRGKRLDPTSLYAPAPVKAGDGYTNWKIWHATPRSPHQVLAGLIDADGHTLVPVQYRHADFVYLGDALWGVSTGASNTPDVADVYGPGARRVDALRPFHDIEPFEHGVTTARTKEGDAVLIDKAGKILASFNALFPRYGTRSAKIDPLVEQALDRCFRSDPTVVPGSVDPATRRICGNRELEALSRATELAYYGAQAGHCLPDVFLALRPAYDKALEACATDTCLNKAMHRFRGRIADAARSCKAGQETKSPDAPVDDRTRAGIEAFLHKADAAFEQDVADAAASRQDEHDDTLLFSRMMLGKDPAVLVYAATYARNEPFWLLRQAPDGRWHLLLSGHSDTGPAAVGGLHNGLPILQIRRNADCCGQEDITYYQYDGKRYRERNSCTLLFDGDGKDAKPLLLCDTPRYHRGP